MHRFNAIMAASLSVILFVSCSSGKIDMIGTNYEFKETYLSIEILYENKTDNILIFPYVYFTNRFKSIYEHDDFIVIDECTADFKNVDEMVDMQLKGIPVDDDNDMSYLNLVAIYSGHKFIYSDIVPYSQFSREKIKSIVVR